MLVSGRGMIPYSTLIVELREAGTPQAGLGLVRLLRSATEAWQPWHAGATWGVVLCVADQDGERAVEMMVYGCCWSDMKIKMNCEVCRRVYWITNDEWWMMMVMVDVVDVVVVVVAVADVVVVVVVVVAVVVVVVVDDVDVDVVVVPSSPWFTYLNTHHFIPVGSCWNMWLCHWCLNTLWILP